METVTRSIALAYLADSGFKDNHSIDTFYKYISNLELASEVEGCD